VQKRVSHNILDDFSEPDDDIEDYFEGYKNENRLQKVLEEEKKGDS